MTKNEKKGEQVEFPEEEITTLEAVTVPEYTLMDVMRELKTTQNDLNTFLGQVKALGSEVVKSNEEVLARMEIQNSDFHEIKDAIVYGLANIGRTSEKPTPTKMASAKINMSKPQQETKIQLPPAATFPISESAKKDLIFGFREGVGTTVKFTRRVENEDWNKTNTFLRALNMVWVSDKTAKVYEWQPK